MAVDSEKATGSGIKVRIAGAADAPAIAAIYAPYVRDTAISFELTPPDADEMAARLSAVQAAGYPYLLAERSSRVIGYAYGTRFRGRPAYDGTVETSVYVDRGALGQGAGSALMAALETELRQRGFKLMVAGYSGNDRPDSVGFHEKLGFTLAGVIPDCGVKFGQGHAVGFLWKRL